MLRMYLGGYKWTIFSFFIPLGYCKNSCIAYSSFNQNQSNLTHMCLNSMSMTVYPHICCLRFVSEKNGIFISDDHIWKCQNLKSHISKTKWTILFKFSGFFRLIIFFQMTQEWVSKSWTFEKLHFPDKAYCCSGPSSSSYRTRRRNYWHVDG